MSNDILKKYANLVDANPKACEIDNEKADKPLPAGDENKADASAVSQNGTC